MVSPQVAASVDCDAQTVEELRLDGHTIADVDLAGIAPLMRKHINPFGKYHVDLTRIQRT